MELSPSLYRCLVRPRWLTKMYICNLLMNNFDFSGKSVLDFGCGIGSNCFIFDPAGYLGVDPDSERIAYAKNFYPEYQFEILKSGKLPITDNSVDYILVIAVLHHIPSEDIQNYMVEFRRVLKPNGKILAIEPCFFPNSSFNNCFMGLLDKGKHIRDTDGYMEIFQSCNYNVRIVKKYKQMFFYNKIFFIATPAKVR